MTIKANRYAAMFKNLNAKQEAAFIPFTTLGYPDKARSLEIIENMIADGADALELGIPFSDPVADGPVIQAANIKALDAGITPDDCFDIIAAVRANAPSTPIGLLVYANLVIGPGSDQFFAKAAKSGVDSVLVADIPFKEINTIDQSAAAHGIDLVLILPPNASETTIQAVAKASQGYTYLLSRAGVTGTETAAGMPLDHLLDGLKRHGGAPAVLGFGISGPDDVRDAVKAGVGGVISGSAVVKAIEAGTERAFVSEMKSATVSAAC